MRVNFGWLAVAILLLVLMHLLAGCSAGPTTLPEVNRRGQQIIYMGPREFFTNIRRTDLDRYRCLVGVVYAETRDGFTYDIRCVTPVFNF